MTDGKFSLTRSIIHNCPALRIPQTWLQQLGNCAQIIPLPGIPEAQAQEIIDRLNAAPEAPKRKPLTDKQLREVLEGTNYMVRNAMHGPFWPELEQACRAVEAAHGIGDEA